MNYISLDDFKYAWAFRHQQLPIDDSLLAKIKPMSESRATNLWATFVSREKDHPDFFDNKDWPGNGKTWVNSVKWESAWDNDDALPDEIINHLDWNENTTVYYCLSRKHVIETDWRTFKATWLNFLFMSDGCLLIGKKRHQVVQFLETGYAKLGKRID